MNTSMLISPAYAWQTWDNNPTNGSGNQWTNQPEWNTPTWENTPEWSDNGWETNPEWNQEVWQNDSTWKNQPSPNQEQWMNSPIWNNEYWQNAPNWNHTTSDNPANNAPDGNNTGGDNQSEQNPSDNSQGNNPDSNPENNGNTNTENSNSTDNSSQEEGSTTPDGEDTNTDGNTDSSNPEGSTSQEGNNPPSTNSPYNDQTAYEELNQLQEQQPPVMTQAPPDAFAPEATPYTSEAWYKAGKVAVKNVAIGSINEFSKIAGPDWFNWPTAWKKNTFNKMDWGKVGRKSFIAGVASTITGTDEAAKNAQLLFDSYYAYDNYSTVKGYINTTDNLKDVWNAAQASNSAANTLRSANNVKNSLTTANTFLQSATQLPSSITTGIAGKIAPWTAAAGIVISGAEMVTNFSNGEVNKGIANVGEMLMSGAVVAGATGFGAPVAAGLAVAGGVIWAGAKIYQHRKAIGRFFQDPVGQTVKAGKAVIESTKKVASAVKDGVSKLGKTISGWFG